MIIKLYLFYILLFQWEIQQIYGDTTFGCTINNNHYLSISSNKTSLRLSCIDKGYILVRNLIFGVHKSSNLSCSYQPGDCTTRTKSIGRECNGLTYCDLGLYSQYLHTCK